MPKHSSTPKRASDLRSIALFTRVIETRSLTEAGRALEMNTSSASKRLTELETRLGVRLLERTTRRVWPTAAGAAFYERCARILRDIDEAELAATELASAPRGKLRVCVPVALGELHVAPLAAIFAERYPLIELDLDLRDRVLGVVDDGFDLALQITSRQQPGSAEKRIASDRAVICGAPSYFEKRGVPASPEGLLRHDCLHATQLSLQDEWAFETEGGPLSVVFVPRACFNHTGAIRAAAIAGLGIARVPRLVVRDALESGALTTVLDGLSARQLSITALFPSSRCESARAQRFVAFLAEELPPRLSNGETTRP